MAANTSESKPAFLLDDRGGEAPHAPALYQPQRIVEPLAGPDAVTDGHIEQFHELGFLSINHLFSAEAIGAAIDGLVELIVNPPEGFTGLQFEGAAADKLDQMTGDELQNAVRKLMRYCDWSEPLRTLRDDPTLRSLVSRLMDGRSPKCFQEMALLKGPGGREKPWHQDHAYFSLALGEPVVGVWIALDHATVDNACMHVIPGSHREGPVVHFQRRDWQICDTDVARDRAVACPLAPGGALLFSGMLHHGTPINRSNQRRRALQYHYCPDDAVWVDQEQRLAVWGSEGKDVEC